jgi:hypothetical protein
MELAREEIGIEEVVSRTNVSVGMLIFCYGVRSVV